MKKGKEEPFHVTAPTPLPSVRQDYHTFLYVNIWNFHADTTIYCKLFFCYSPNSQSNSPSSQFNQVTLVPTKLP